MSTLPAWAESLEQSPIGSAIAESRYAFPIIEGTHLIALSVAVGLIAITDLRLIGVLLKSVPADEVLRALRPYMLGGFLLVFVTGGLLFWAEASSVLASPAFVFKLLFIILAGLNAAYFEFRVARQPGAWDEGSAISRKVKLAGAASLVLWSLTVICGRLIPYLTKWP